MKREIEIDNNSIPLWYKDKFYKVYSFGYCQTFNPTCPACGYTRKITYMGKDGVERECNCPVCVGHNRYDNLLRLNNYEVREFTVSRIEITGPDSMSGIKDKNTFPKIDIYGFSNKGHGYGGQLRTSVDARWINVPLEETENVNSDHYTFLDKKDAERYVDYLKERDRKILAEFNEKYGTGFKYPY